ncbi:MAG: hypothetical protein WAL75_04475 [Terracidiphilus sp.]
MKSRNSLILSISSTCLILVGAQLSGAQGPSTTTDPAAADSHAVAGLVQAEVTLTRSLDARNDKPGATFEARLKSTVHLKDGTQLPIGTLLEGKVATPDAKDAKSSQLSLVFTDAKLKSGKDVPIQATIVGLADPAFGTDLSATYDGPAAWNGTTTQIDLTGALNNVDLHSTIGDENSGTLKPSGKGNLKLNSGVRISLALGVKSANNQHLLAADRR